MSWSVMGVKGLKSPHTTLAGHLKCQGSTTNRANRTYSPYGPQPLLNSNNLQIFTEYNIDDSG